MIIKLSLHKPSGFEGCLGSSKDDTIISSGDINKIAGGSGDDVLIGDEQDFVDYSLEQSFAHQSQAFHLNKGIAKPTNWSSYRHLRL